MTAYDVRKLSPCSLKVPEADRIYVTALASEFPRVSTQVFVDSHAQCLSPAVLPELLTITDGIICRQHVDIVIDSQIMLSTTGSISGRDFHS